MQLSFTVLLKNALLIVKHPQVMAYTVAVGFVFGALLLYLSTAQALFLDLYDAGARFPLYFAILAFGIGLSSFMNGHLVMRFGMHRLSVAALLGMAVFAGVLLLVASQHDGRPPFLAFMAICFLMFCCIGMLFGNLNAMAMQSLGRIAGLGASVIASLSSGIAVILSVVVGRFYDQTALPLAAGFILAGLAALALVLYARRCQTDAI